MIQWSGDQFVKEVQTDLAKNFTRAGVYFTSKVRGYLNTSQSYKRTEKGGYVGFSPSSPGQFPHKLSGQLQRSITWKVDKAKLTLTVGSNLAKYPSFLELGTRYMKPRPWLTLSFNLEKDRIGKLITGKGGK